ncbi:MAG: tetratricopeptide repeat protein [Candidatus Altiarchaeota archaeon]
MSFEHFGRGNSFYWSGKYPQALEEYSKSIKTDSSLADAYLSRAFTLTHLKRYDEALKDLDHVILMDSSVTEAYIARGMILEQFYEYSRAIGDYETALRLDPGNQKALSRKKTLHINALRNGVDVAGEEELLEKIIHRKAASTPQKLLNRIKSIRRGLKSVERPSCTIDCGKVCCHFREDMWRHGIMILPQNLKSIRQLLESMGLDARDYIESIDYDRCLDSGRKRFSKPRRFKTMMGGRQVVNYPKRKNSVSRLPDEADWPKTLDCNSIGWAAGDSKPCSFLTDKGCMIFNAKWDGGNGLDSCRRWICLTGYVMGLMKNLKVTLPERVNSYGIGGLNLFAEKAVGVLFTEVYGRDELCGVMRSKMEALSLLASGKMTSQEESETLQRYLYLSRRQAKITAESLRNAGEKIRETA